MAGKKKPGIIVCFIADLDNLQILTKGVYQNLEEAAEKTGIAMGNIAAMTSSQDFGRSTNHLFVRVNSLAEVDTSYIAKLSVQFFTTKFYKKLSANTIKSLPDEALKELFTWMNKWKNEINE